MGNEGVYMSLALLLYLADISTNIENFLHITSIGTYFITLIYLIVGAASIDKDWTFQRYLKFSIPFLFLCGLTGVSKALLPSPRTIYAYGAETVVRDIASNPRVQALYDKSMKILEDKLDKIGKKNE